MKLEPGSSPSGSYADRVSFKASEDAPFLITALRNDPKRSAPKGAEKGADMNRCSALAELPPLPPPLPAFEAALNRFKKAFEESRPDREAP